MIMRFPFFILLFFLFVSCKQRKHIKEQPEINIDSLKSVSQVAYMKETKAFLGQLFSPQGEMTYVLNEQSYLLTDKDIKAIQLDAINVIKNDIDSIQILAKNILLNQWNRKEFSAYKIVANDSIESTIRSKGWNQFYKSYGFGYHNFSAPIFIKNYSYSIFYESFVCGLLCGHGKLCLYQKQNGKWKLIKTFSHWIS